MARNIKINDDGTYTVKLRCLDVRHAAELFELANRPGDKYHNVELEGDLLSVTFMDLRFPMDVAEVGFTGGHVEDAEAADIISSVQLDPEALRP